MTGRNPSNTPDFDSHVLNAVGEDGSDNGGQQQPQQQDSGGSNAQPTPPPDPNAQPSAFDDVIARTERPDPNTQQAQPDPNKPKPNQQPPPKPPGAPVLDENGQPVPAGVAQRHFFARKNAEKAANKAQGEVQQLRGQLQAFTQLHQTMQQSGLNAQEQATSLSLGAALKKDPVKAATQLLTELKAAGINIDDAMGVNSIDTNSIAQLIDQKLAPLTGRFRQEQEQAQREEEIADDVHGFFEEYPQAQIHTAELNVLLQKFPDWSIDKAWSEFRIGAIQNGLDLNRPLRPQIAARRGNGNPKPAPNGGARVPMVSNGRGGVQQQPHVAPKSYDHNANIRDMVRDSLAEAGVDVSRL